MPTELTMTLTPAEEMKLRNLAYGIAKGIEEPKELIRRCGFTMDEYMLLSESNMFKAMLEQAVNEWAGASNTQKRVKLKAAVNIEESLPSFYHAMTNPKEPLAARVKVFEVMSKVAGLGIAEPVAAGGGQAFRLEINLGDGRRMTVANTIEHNPTNEMVTESVSATITEEEVIDEEAIDGAELNISITNVFDEFSAGLEELE